MIVCPLDPFGRAKGGEGIVYGRDVAGVRPQSSGPFWLDALTHLGAITPDNEVACQAADQPGILD